VVVVEHDPEIISEADYIIDLGPGAGEYGGQVIFAGPMKDFLADQKSLTAKYIRGELSIPLPPARRPVTDCLKIYGARKHNLKILTSACRWEFLSALPVSRVRAKAH